MKLSQTENNGSLILLNKTHAQHNKNKQNNGYYNQFNNQTNHLGYILGEMYPNKMRVFFSEKRLFYNRFLDEFVQFPKGAIAQPGRAAAF